MNLAEEITTLDISEIRAAFAKIAERVKNAPSDFIGSIRGSTAAKADRYITKLEREHADLLSRRHVCECCGELFGFEIDTARERPSYLAMEQARIDRLKEGDEAISAGVR